MGDAGFPGDADGEACAVAELNGRPLMNSHLESGARVWDQMFAGGAGAGPTRSIAMRLVRKRGRPWLLVPAEPRLAVRVLELYPAQSPRARVLRLVLRGALRFGLPFGSKPVSVACAPAGQFVHFLSGLQPGGDLPDLGILAGNPATPGQRFLLLLFDAAGEPAMVVKVGLEARARELIQRETQVLLAVPGKTNGVPTFRGRFESPTVCAFALDFVRGTTPAGEVPGQVAALLGAWLRRGQQIRVGQTRAWAELKGSAAGNPLFRVLAGKMEQRAVCAALIHGDFAPWNIKVQPDGRWIMVDWERGDLAGLPGWDWLHFVLQPAILVAHDTTRGLLERLERLFVTPEFQSYSQAGGIAGLERELALAYLLYHCEVVRPSEGLRQARNLLGALSSRWLPA